MNKNTNIIFIIGIDFRIMPQAPYSHLKYLVLDTKQDAISYKDRLAI